MGGRLGTCRRFASARIAAHPTCSAALIFALLVLGYLWPVLVGGKILASLANLYTFAVWKPYAPHDVLAYHNGVLADPGLVLYPWRTFARQLIHAGVLPAWNPYALAGIPFYSNPQTGLFSLFNVPLWILSLTYGLGVSAALKLLVGACGTYLLVRQLRLGFLPGLLAGVAFAFSSLNIVWLAHETLPAVAVLAPWTLWLVERILERRRAGDALALAAAVAIGLGGGHPGMQVHLLAVTAAYALARALWVHGEARRGATVGTRLHALALVGGGLAAGTLLMAFMLIPEVRSAHETVGVLARKAQALPGQHIPFAALQTVVFPDRWGRPSAFENVLDRAHNPFGIVNYNERTFYAGVVAFLFAGVGLLARGGWRRRAPFLLLGPFGLAVALRAPGALWLTTHLPVLSSVEAERLHFAFELSVAVLSAFGLQALIDTPAQDRRRLALAALALLGGALALATAGASGADAVQTLRHFLTGVDSTSSGVLALTSIVWFLIFSLGVAAALLAARWRPSWRFGVAAAVVALAVADAYHFAYGYQPMAPASKAIPPVTPAIAYLERHRAEGRIAGVEAVLPSDWGLTHGLEDARGYDTPQPTRRMLALWRLANPEQATWTGMDVPTLTPQALRVLGVLGVRYIAFPPASKLTRDGSGILRVVYHGPDAMILRFADAAPRAFAPSRVLTSRGEAYALGRIAEAGFDPRTTAVVEEDQPGAKAVAAAAGSVAIVRRENARVTLRAQLDRRGVVVLNEALMEGWSVRVDGRPARALYANGVMRGVVVPAGRHEIVWSYAVPGLRLGVAISLLTLAALAGGALALAFRARRRDRARLR
jgi:membrane protein YfhO